MSQGYEKFFKAAKVVKARNAGSVAPPKQRASRPPVKASRPKTPFPWGAFVMSLILFGSMALIASRPEILDQLAAKVEIRWLGSVQAANTGQNRSAPESGARQNPPQGPAIQSEVGPQVDLEYNLEDINHFSRLAERKRELDERERQLNRLEEELHRQKGEIDGRLRQLEEMRTQIAEVLKDRVETDRERVDRLVEVYSNMRPQQAAQIIASLNDDLAVEILGSMKRQNAAEILNVLDPEKAQSLTEKFAGYKR